MTATPTETRNLASDGQNQSLPWGRLIFNTPTLRDIDLFKREIYVGRKNVNDVVISHPSVSGIHCRVTRDSDGFIFIKDISTNGTWLDGKLIGKQKKRYYTPGAQVVIIPPCVQDDVKISFNIVLYAPVSSNLASKIVNYDVHGPIGCGAFASVRMCVEKESGQKFAMKIVDKRKFTIANTSAREKSPEDEAKLLQGLKHPNIIQIHDAFESKDHFYLIMELAMGGDLLDLLISLGHGLSEAYTHKLFLQVCSVVQYLHSQGLAHRDIKPENILLVSKAVDSDVKLTDFGLSRFIGESRFMQTICGSPMYIAPELILCMEGKWKEGYDQAVDLWALGVLLFMMLTNAVPFDPRLATPILEQSKSGKYKYPAAVEPTLSVEVKHLISKLLVVDPTRRADIHQVLSHPWIKGEKLSAAELGTWRAMEAALMAKQYHEPKVLSSQRNEKSISPTSPDRIDSTTLTVTRQAESASLDQEPSPKAGSKPRFNLMKKLGELSFFKK